MRTIQKAPLGFAVLAIIVLGTAVAMASDAITVAYGTNQSITVFSLCKRVTNASPTGLSVYVPNTTAAEWASFYGSPPNGVTAGVCAESITTSPSVLPVGRYGHSCTTDLVTGKIYCFGGSSTFTVATQGFINQIVEFNPTTGAVTIKSAVLPQRAELLSCVTHAPTNKIYCFGGQIFNGSSVVSSNKIYEYNPLTDTIVTKTEVLPIQLEGLSCVASKATNTIFCFGGAWGGGAVTTVYEYTPSTGAIVAKSNLPEGLYVLSCAPNPVTNNIYCFGGANSMVLGTRSIYEYNPSTNVMTTKTALLPINNSEMACVGNQNGKIYCFGGSTDAGPSRDILEYSSAIDSIVTKTAKLPLATQRVGCSAELISGKIFCSGGFIWGPGGSTITLLTTITEYDPGG